MHTGIAIDGNGIEVVVNGAAVGQRTMLTPDDVHRLTNVTTRYARYVRDHSGDAALLALGRELWEWLDGDVSRLRVLANEAQAPVVFEVRAPQVPTDAAWSVLHAPWELLARPEGEGFIAADALRRWSFVRRLGTRTPAPPLSDYRLGLAFMAASPRDASELDFEAEEHAILDAVGETHLDLLVDDTGDSVQLGHRLADSGGMPVVHLSCHGHNSWPDPERPGSRSPVLLLESEIGEAKPTLAADLVRCLSIDAHSRPRLVFVSACLTATTPEVATSSQDGRPDDAVPVAHSYATALITAGTPAVLGWDGSVGDRAATEFARHLYAALALRADLAGAVGDARRDLLRSRDDRVRSDWHLARLWLGPAGGSSLVAGNTQRALTSATHGTRTFLDRKQQVPVAAPDVFVGRRLEMQQALRALRGQHCGVLLHGQGRLGKSSLAARLADRFAATHALGVLFGDYTTTGLLHAVREAVSANREARDLIDERASQVRERPDLFEGLLTDLLAGPCAQTDSGRNSQPLLLVIDDLEQAMEPHAGSYRLLPDAANVLDQVLRAFDTSHTKSRLIVTSRYTFTLGGREKHLESVQLRPFSAVAQRKLQSRQEQGTSVDRVTETEELARRALAVSRGNPGLQDVIVGSLVYGPEVPVERADAAVTQMEQFLDQGGVPDEPALRDILEKMALDALLRVATDADRALLQALTLFEIPVPDGVADAVADEVGGSIGALRVLGLVDAHASLYQHDKIAVACNPLVAGRLEPLTSRERSTLARSSVDPLLAAASRVGPAPGRGSVFDVQLAKLAVLAENPDVVALVANAAVRALSDGHAGVAAELGREAVEILDRSGRRVSLDLLRSVGSVAGTAGDGDLADRLLTRAANTAQNDESEDELTRARALAEFGRRQQTRGENDEALNLFERARSIFERAGSEGEAAVTWGKIADVLHQRGDLDEAAELQERRLAVNEKLGDVDGIAAANWGLAQIDLARNDFESAFPRVEMAFVGLNHLQRPDGIALVGSVLGQLYAANDRLEDGRAVLEMSLVAARRIGHRELVQHVENLLAQLPGATPAPDRTPPAERRVSRLLGRLRKGRDGS